MAGSASPHLTRLIAFPDRLGLGVGGQPRSQLLVPFIPLGRLKASLTRGCPSSLLLAPLPPSRGSRQSTLVKPAVKPRPSPVPLGCTWQRGPGREARGEARGWGVGFGRPAVVRAAGSGPLTLGGAAPQARDPLREAGGSPGAECGSRACGAARSGREKDAPAEERRGRPVSPEEPAAPERREPGNRSTKRQGSRPALTCKQGFHLEQPAHTDPQTHSLAPRSACNQSTCPPLGPPGSGPGCWRLPARPRRLRPRGRGSRPPGGCPAPGPRCPARRVGVVAPEVSGPRLRSAPGSPGFTPPPPPAAQPAARWEGAGLRSGQGVRGRSPSAGSPAARPRLRDSPPERGRRRREAGARKEGRVATSSGTPAPRAQPARRLAAPADPGAPRPPPGRLP